MNIRVKWYASSEIDQHSKSVKISPHTFQIRGCNARENSSVSAYLSVHRALQRHSILRGVLRLRILKLLNHGFCRQRGIPRLPNCRLNVPIWHGGIVDLLRSCSTHLEDSDEHYFVLGSRNKVASLSSSHAVGERLH